MRLTIETEREEDGRWIAEIPELPGVMTYGGTVDDAVRACRALALEVLAGRLRAGEQVDSIQFVAA
jgi:predicted RNase H-like HicB family nuclease